MSLPGKTNASGRKVCHSKWGRRRCLCYPSSPPSPQASAPDPSTPANSSKPAKFRWNCRFESLAYLTHHRTPNQNYPLQAHPEPTRQVSFRAMLVSLHALPVWQMRQVLLGGRHGGKTHRGLLVRDLRIFQDHASGTFSGEVHLHDTKTDSRSRSVPLTDTMCRELLVLCKIKYRHNSMEKTRFHRRRRTLFGTPARTRTRIYGLGGRRSIPLSYRGQSTRISYAPYKAWFSTRYGPRTTAQ